MISDTKMLAPAGFQVLQSSLADFPKTARQYLNNSDRRFGHLTARPISSGFLAIEALLLDLTCGGGVILTATLPLGEREYPSISLAIPAAHWAERAVGDMFGVRAVGHPHWNSLIMHDDAWPLDIAPLMPDPPAEPGKRRQYKFLKVVGEGIHEIPVGPIHAGIIEPGHFRFSCVGEIITNLEIRLGYQHRGIEKRLTEIPWLHARYVAESASSDTAAGNALAHAIAIEQLLVIEAPPRAVALRTIALELERLANHVGDLGAMAGDIGYSVGASLFPPMRGMALALAQTLTGSRRQRWFILPGGVARDLNDTSRASLAKGLAELKKRIVDNVPLILQHPSVLDRMEGTGKLSPGLARDFGVVGPAGRASGVRYDSRTCFMQGIYPKHAPAPAVLESGDVLARAQVKKLEIATSIAVIEMLLDELPNTPIQIALPHQLPPSRIGIGIVEAWRGELIHWISTNEEGLIARYSIKDPSFNNWTGLAVAVRGNLVADFPLCNKSFNLSYSGSDL